MISVDSLLDQNQSNSRPIVIWTVLFFVWSIATDIGMKICFRRIEDINRKNL